MEPTDGNTPASRGLRSPAPSSAALGPPVELSDLDRGMIRLLQSDGRRSFTDMAAELGIASRTVRRRVERLLDEGIIEITTVAHPELLGYGASAMVGIRGDGSVTSADIASALVAVDEIDYVIVATGRFALFAEVLCPTTDDLIATVETQIQPLAGVAGCETFPYLRLYYQQPQWDATRAKPGAPQLPRDVDLDDLDRRIIVELNHDGRASFRAVAEALGVSEGVVRQRAARLTESGAVRVMAITNPLSLGFRLIAWLAIEVAPDARLDEVAEQVAGCSAIAYLALCAGRYDVFAEAICTDREDLLRLLDEEIRPIPGIARVEVFLCADLRYRRLRPRFPRLGTVSP